MLVRLHTGLATVEISLEDSQNLKINLQYDPAIPLLSICLADSTLYFTGTYSAMFIASLFIVLRKGKQSKYCTTEEWIMKLWYIYSVEWDLAVKKNEIMNFAGKWLEVCVCVW